MKKFCQTCGDSFTAYHDWIAICEACANELVAKQGHFDDAPEDETTED